MNAPFRFGALAAVCLLFAAPSFSRAQDAPPAPPPSPPAPAPHVHRCPTCGAEIPADRCPTCGSPLPKGASATGAPDPLDRKLDEVLRREYGDPNAVPAPPPATEEEIAPPPPPTMTRHVRDEDDEWSDSPLKVKLGLLASHWSGHILDASVSSSRMGADAPYVPIAGSANSVADLDWFHSQRYGAWIDLGKHVTIEAYGWNAVMRDSESITRDFSFHGDMFVQGEQVQTKLELTTIDANVVVRPLNCRWARLDIILGGRYMRAQTKFNDAGFPDFKATENVEAGIPMIGIGGAFRPVRTEGGEFMLELYARGRVGGMAFKDRAYNDGSYGSDDYTTETWKMYALEAEGGVTISFYDTVGAQLGVRYEVNSILKDDVDATKRATWRALGPFFALYVELP